MTSARPFSPTSAPTSLSLVFLPSSSTSAALRGKLAAEREIWCLVGSFSRASCSNTCQPSPPDVLREMEQSLNHLFRPQTKAETYKSNLFSLRMSFSLFRKVCSLSVNVTELRSGTETEEIFFYFSAGIQ